MTDSIHETVLRTLEQMESPLLVDQQASKIMIPIPNRRGEFLLVEVVIDDDDEEAFFRCGIITVPQSQRSAILELLNDLNLGLKPFNRWTLAGDVASVQVRCDLSFAEHPEELIVIALGRILHAIDFGAERVLDAVANGYSPAAEAAAEAARIMGESDGTAEYPEEGGGK